MTNKTGLNGGAAFGMLWISVAVVISKGMSLITQVALGYLLSVEEFGVFALVAGIMAVSGGFQDPGLGKLLVQKQREFAKFFSLALFLSLLLSIFGGGVILVVAKLLNNNNEQGDYLNLLFLIALTMPLMSMSLIFKAKVSVDLRFKVISIADMVSAIGYGIAVVISALLGMGVYSFVIGIAVLNVFNFFYYFRTAKIKEIKKPDVKLIGEIWNALKWLVMGSLLVGVSLRGDYLILGELLTEDALGFYYFGFMLTANLGLLLSQGINGVLMPSFSAMRGDINRMLSAFSRASSILVLSAGLLCLLMVVFSPFLVTAIWSGKWDQAIPVAILMAVTLPLRMLSPLGGALLESLGSWKSRVVFLFVDAASLILSALAGGWLLGLEGAACAVAIQRGTFGLALFYRASYELGQKFTKTFFSVIKYYLPFLLTVSVIFYWGEGVYKPEVSLLGFISLCYVSLFSSIAYLLLSFIFNRSGMFEVCSIMSGFIKSRRANV